MKKYLIDEQDLRSAIHDAFHGGASCHCQTVAKLGEKDLLLSLARQKIIPFSGVIGIDALTIETLSSGTHEGLIPSRCAWILHRKGFRFLTELTKCSYADVLALEGLGRQGVNALQDAMAQFGLLFKGGDPALLRREWQPAPEQTNFTPADNPDQIRQTCSAALLKLGNQIIRDGAGLVRIASRLGAGQKQSGALTRYASVYQQAGAAEVAAICRPLIALDDLENQQTGKQAGPKQKRALASDPAKPIDNVIRDAFAS